MSAVLEQGPSTFYPGELRFKCPACEKFEVKGIVCSACYSRVCPGCRTEMDSKGPVQPCDAEGRGGSDLYQCPKCKNVEIT